MTSLFQICISSQSFSKFPLLIGPLVSFVAGPEEVDGGGSAQMVCSPPGARGNLGARVGHGGHLLQPS